MSLTDFNVRTSDERRVAMPANAVCRTKWIEVFFVSSATGPNVRATSTTRRYVASTEGSFVAKCDLTLMQTDSSPQRGPELDSGICGRSARPHHIERARMSSPLAAV